MANLDSSSKRASSVQVLAPWILSPVLPDGTITLADRQHVAWSYSGIAATTPEAGVPLTVDIRDLSFTLHTRTPTLTLDPRDRSLTLPDQDD